MSTTVLLVEPSLMFQHLYLALFRALECRTTCVASLADALQALEKTAPSLIVIGIRRPAASGIHAARCLRAVSGFERTPIIVLDTPSSAAEQQALCDLALTVFVARPIQIDHFSGLARRCIGATA